ncbi:MAG: mechanosensitive ion channel family protein [Candidatus Magasanikbacteria bacterium]|jgi:small-conductance mechanosensitive channel|nr:mechanosensitive ion channel family protein [Candidatus Magasanikbacteria bacterium]
MEEIISVLSSYTYLNNTLWQYTLAIGYFFGVLIALKIFKSFILVKLNKIAEKTENTIDDAVINTLQKIRAPFYFFISFFIAIRHVNINEVALKAISVFLIFGIAYEMIKSLGDLIDYIIDLYIEKTVKKEKEKKQMRSMMRILRIFIMIVLWSITLLFILSNLGINVTSVVASLGIGGLAIALAVQNVLSDIFSAFSIYLDKPFEVGDFIIIGSDSGSVEHIGLKTTRLRTIRGEVLIISNKELTSTRVKNLRQLKKRRDSFMVNVQYETPIVKREKIPQIIEKIIENIEGAEYLRCNLFEFGESSINYELAYTIDSADYNVFMAVREQINLAIMKAFEKEDIQFAYPTQVVYVKK